MNSDIYFPYTPDLHILTDEIEDIHYFDFVKKLFKDMPLDYKKFHCALGLVGEGGELADAIKKELIYKKPIDLANITEELGDAFFYLVATMQTYGLDWNDILNHNYNKLKVRYQGLVYSDQAAQDRADKHD